MNNQNQNIQIVFPDEPTARSLAEYLEKELLSFRLPKSVIRKTGIHDISEVKERWLIVLCTPETPQDYSVETAIRQFIKDGLYHRILALLCSGTPEESFPKSICFEELSDGSVIEHEPLAANIVAENEKESRKLLRVEKLRLLAPIIGVSFDDLMRRSHRRMQRILFAAGAVVIAAAGLFLAYALIRGNSIKQQNLALEEQYTRAEGSRDAAQSQRDKAQEQFSLSTAVNAKKALDSGNQELALLLCLEFLPDIGADNELADVFDKALHGLCAQGYVPVTTAGEYDKTRYFEKEEPGPGEDLFPKTISLRVPEGYRCDSLTYSLSKEAASSEYGFAVYSGHFDALEEDEKRTSVYITRVCFSDEKKSSDADAEDYYLTDADGNPIDLWCGFVLPDGSVLGYRNEPEIGFTAYRFDPFSREFLPFYDEQEYDAVGSDRKAASPLGMLPNKNGNGLRGYDTFEGNDYLFGFYDPLDSSKPGEFVLLSRDPFGFVRSFGTFKSLTQIEGSGLLMGRDGTAFFFFDPVTLELLYKIEDEYTASGAAAMEAVYADGRQYLALSGTNLGIALYDMNSGDRLCDISGNGVAGFIVEDNNLKESYSFSSEGFFIAVRGETPIIIDPETGTVLRTIPGAGNNPSCHGQADENGLRSASAIKCAGIVYEYREEEIEVPKTLEDRITLAKTLLNGRELTELERKTYNLE